jgi:hypothetical protein
MLFDDFRVQLLVVQTASKTGQDSNNNADSQYQHDNVLIYQGIYPDTQAQCHPVPLDQPDRLTSIGRLLTSVLGERVGHAELAVRHAAGDALLSLVRAD